MKIRSYALVATLFCLFTSFLALAAGDAPVVRVEQGAMLGMDLGASYSFKGISYATPPVGSLRWQPPKPAPAWQGVRDARAYGQICVQTPMMNPHGFPVGSEDCLSLNVWTPTIEPGAKLPVMFFVHGGAEIWGSSSDWVMDHYAYDGQYLAEHGSAVVVTINYRLGIFGFLAHPGGLSGNYGILDIIEALHWVQRNIPAFGGDPSRVLLFGESAGGMNTLALLTSPQAQGLFSRAIVESGVPANGTLTQAERDGEHLAAALGCEPGAPAIECMRGVDPKTLVKVSIDESAFFKPGGVRLGPNIDGTILPEPTMNALAEGRHVGVPLIIGTNAREMTSLMALVSETPIDQADKYVALVERDFGHELGPKILAHYPVGESSSPLEAAYALYGDGTFHCPTRRIARAMSSTQSDPIWRYLFSHTFHGGPLKKYGAGHAFELNYVFHNFSWLPLFSPDEDEKRLSELFVGYWTRFAASGDPNGAGAPPWPEYDSDADRYLELNSSVRVGEGIRASDCDFWDQLGV